MIPSGFHADSTRIPFGQRCGFHTDPSCVRVSARPTRPDPTLQLLLERFHCRKVVATTGEAL